MKLCKKCGFEAYHIQDNFCRQCGADFAEHKVTLACCGEKVLEKPGKYCCYCGTLITQQF